MSMSWDDREDNMIHVHDREEARDARRFVSGGTCYGAHRMGSDGSGGGTCGECGMTVSAAEL